MAFWNRSDVVEWTNQQSKLINNILIESPYCSQYVIRTVSRPANYIVTHQTKPQIETSIIKLNRSSQFDTDDESFLVVCYRTLLVLNHPVYIYELEKSNSYCESHHVQSSYYFGKKMLVWIWNEFSSKINAKWVCGETMSGVLLYIVLSAPFCPYA